jgi:hypothetical protein
MISSKMPAWYSSSKKVCAHFPQGVLAMRSILPVLLSALLATGSAWGQLKTLVDIPEGDTVVEIDNETESVVIQSGLGFPPSDAKTEAQRIVWAISEARANAVVNAALALSKVNVTSQTQLDKLRLSSREIRSAFEYVLQGAQEMRIKRTGANGAYVAEIALPLTGPHGVNQAIIPEVRRRAAKIVPSPAPDWEELEPQTQTTSDPPPVPLLPPVEQEDSSPPSATEDYSVYTGLVIDVRGKDVHTAFAPRILAENGRVVYDVLKASLADSKGMVGYAASPSSPTIQDRVGDNPLTLDALRGQENVDVVVSVEDAGRVLHTDQLTNILAECRVAFILDSN